MNVEQYADLIRLYASDQASRSYIMGYYCGSNSSYTLDLDARNYGPEFKRGYKDAKADSDYKS